MRILIPFLILFSAFLAQADAFDLYIKKDYRGAAEALEKELATNKDNPLTLYNLGVTAEKLGKPGHAVYYYLQALQAAPALSEARANLDALVKTRVIEIPKAINTSNNGIGILLIAFFVSLYLFALLLIIYIFKPNWKLRLALLPAFLIAVLFTTLFILRYRDLSSEMYAVVLNAQEIKSGPDEALTTVGKLRDGEIIEIKNISGTWVRARSFQDNIEGWVDAKSIRQLQRRIE